MAILSQNDFVFEVRRCEPELVSPAKATPHEFKQLSDIDDQLPLRFQVPLIFFYAHNPWMQGRDPVKVIKKALSETLVFYYPFAGRLREGPGRKLFVECTAEGALFIEADADVSLEQFGDAIKPPFTYLADVLYNVPNSDDILDSPLLLFQVTRLKCGGFIFAIRVNHTMSDGYGFLQFLTAMTELARGFLVPTINPVWQRALLNARDPPTVTFEHDQVLDNEDPIIVPVKEMAHCTIFFGPAEISTLRKSLPPHLHHCSSFDLITACLWRTRIIALHPDPNEEMSLFFVVNLRFRSISLPLGYYGNAFVSPRVVVTTREIYRNPLAYVVELVKKAKNEVTEEYIKSAVDLLRIKRWPDVVVERSFIVSDATKFRFDDIDFGWGKPFYGGTANRGGELVPGLTSSHVRFKNNKGEEGTVVLISLPAPAMERFVVQLNDLFNTKLLNDVNNSKRPLIPSGL